MASLKASAVGGRYLLKEQIGHGGMAVVHGAIDQQTGKRVAFKRLTPREDDESSQRTREYFEREYHTLIQLAHPRIVTAYEYGLDGALPYYTMELLDGGDLLEQSPMPWQRACSVIRDICAALSIVHSRRMVYRDLSPRNVRCTLDGHAKLLDFGAMAPMGPAPLAVCTPAVASPEVVYRLPLDGRSDLYALGALLYFTLTGRNAYPARTFNHLPTLWQEPLRAPSEITPEIPAALDSLVMDLLQLDVDQRPASAAEVSERLSAIAGLAADEQLLFARAYLTTPTLVGREREQRKIQGAFRRVTARGKGTAWLVRGAQGSGRSRFLDECAIAAKLAGLTVVRTVAGTAEEAGTSLRLIAEQLAELVAGEPNAPAPPALGDAGSMRAFVLEVARRTPLLLAVDDFDRLDPAASALVALLAHEAPSSPLVVIATTGNDTGADSDASRVLTGGWRELSLSPLELEETRALLLSMFGDVPHLSGLVQRLHATAQGNPQALMLLAQHLLDRGTVRYSGGVWVLPERLDASELPATLAQAFRAACERLSDDARALGRAFAICADQAFSVEECVTLCEDGDWAKAFRAIDELLAASVLAMRGSAYTLSLKAWVEPLLGEPDPALEQRLAALFEARGDGPRAASHLFRIGHDQRAVDVMVEFSKRSYQQTSTSSEAYVRLIAGLPHDWRAIFDRGIALCSEQGRPASDWLAIQMRASSLMSQNDISSRGRLVALAQRIAREAGLDVYAELDASMPEPDRLRHALGAAAARYAATPEHERMLDPKEAIGALARNMVVFIGNYSRTMDVNEWRQMPQLAPLAPLSPAVAMVERLARGFDARVSGRFEQACAIYRDTLAMMEGSGANALDPTFIESMRAALHSIVGMIEAALGLDSSERDADEVAKFTLYQGSALAIRMVHRMWLGDIASANAFARQTELARLEQGRTQTGDTLATLWMLKAHVLSDDLTHTRQYLEAAERLAAKADTWQPIAAWARGEYERIRGDHAAALASLDSSLAALPEATHQVWPFVAGARVRVLCEQQRFAEAREAGERYLAAAEAAGLGYVVNYIRMPLAIAAAKLGDATAAWLHARAVLDSFTALGARGINIGLAHETATRVAAALGDEAQLEQHAELCKAAFLAFPNAALAAKFQRLSRSLRGLRGTARADAGVGGEAMSAMARSQLQSLLQTCSGSEERLRCALQVLVEGTGALGGALYGFTDGMLTLRAQSGERTVPTEMESQALRYARVELGGDETASETGSEEGGSALERAWTSAEGRYYKPVLLNHVDTDGFVASGMVLLAFESLRPVRVAADTTTLLSRTMVQAGDLKPVRIAS